MWAIELIGAGSTEALTHSTRAKPCSLTGVCVCAHLPHLPRSTNAQNAPGLDLLPQVEMGIGILEEWKENRLGTPP
jgi:hypothetical protein